MYVRTHRHIPCVKKDECVHPGLTGGGKGGGGGEREEGRGEREGLCIIALVHPFSCFLICKYERNVDADALFLWGKREAIIRNIPDE